MAFNYVAYHVIYAASSVCLRNNIFNFIADDIFYPLANIILGYPQLIVHVVAEHHPFVIFTRHNLIFYLGIALTSFFSCFYVLS